MIILVVTVTGQGGGQAKIYVLFQGIIFRFHMRFMFKLKVITQLSQMLFYLDPNLYLPFGYRRSTPSPPWPQSAGIVFGVWTSCEDIGLMEDALRGFIAGGFQGCAMWVCTGPPVPKDLVFGFFLLPIERPRFMDTEIFRCFMCNVRLQPYHILNTENATQQVGKSAAALEPQCGRGDALQGYFPYPKERSYWWVGSSSPKMPQQRRCWTYWYLHIIFVEPITATICLFA